MKLFLLSLILLSQLYTQSRGLWVTRYTLTSTKNIEDLKSFAIKNNVSDVFLQVRGRSDAYYFSNIEKNHRLKFNNNKQIQDLIGYLKKHNINTHIWINVFLMASSIENLGRRKNHILKTKKNWVDASIDFTKLSKTIELTDDLKDNPDLEGIYVLPCFPDLENYYKEIIKELITLFKPAGIHFDYFRLAGKKYGFHPRMRMLFSKERNLNAEYLMRDHNNLELSTFYKIEKEWIDFLNKKFTTFLKTMTKVDKKIKWSVAVKPDPLKAKNEYAQNWQNWINNDIVDFVVPMNYAKNENTFNSRLDSYLKVKNAKKIWVGVASYNQSFDELKIKLKKVNDNNLNVSIFSFNDLLKKKIEIVFNK